MCAVHAVQQRWVQSLAQSHSAGDCANLSRASCGNLLGMSLFRAHLLFMQVWLKGVEVAGVGPSRMRDRINVSIAP
jgi:hypothetical protein